MFAVKYKVKDILKIIKDNEKYPSNKRWNKENKAKLLFNDPRINRVGYVNFYNLYMVVKMFNITKVESISISVDYKNEVLRLYNDNFNYELKMKTPGRL